MSDRPPYFQAFNLTIGVVTVACARLGRDHEVSTDSVDCGPGYGGDYMAQMVAIDRAAA